MAIALGSGLAGLAGVALAPLLNVNPNMGTGFIVDSFMVVVLGGVGSLAGAVLASLGSADLDRVHGAPLRRGGGEGRGPSPRHRLHPAPARRALRTEGTPLMGNQVLFRLVAAALAALTIALPILGGPLAGSGLGISPYLANIIGQIATFALLAIALDLHLGLRGGPVSRPRAVLRPRRLPHRHAHAEGQRLRGRGP